MQNVRRRDTPYEVSVRRRLHARGLRYRVDVAPLHGLRRRADIVFRRAKVAVFLDGCFWHGCEQHGSWPKNNAEWWRDKITANQRRDEETSSLLRAAGWEVLRIWEHEDPDDAAGRVATLVEHRAT